jgi:AcrR family transcriptional regulator
MAKAGIASRTRRASPDASATRSALVDAAIEALREVGFAGASARVIASRAGCNQALVFYHFGSVVDLLLAALDEVSVRRMDRYREATADLQGPAELVQAAQQIFSEDLDHGYVSVLAQMIAGASTTPGLGTEVAARIAPWRTFTEEVLRGALGESPLQALLPSYQVSHAVVALYLGLEMLSQLDGDKGAALALFSSATQLVGLLAAATPATTTGARPRRTR